MMPNYTPTEQRIMTMLSDGQFHTRGQLMGCLGDELTAVGTLHVHLTNLRQKLRPMGQDIIFRNIEGVSCYMHARILASPYRG